jgi:hypothetical protein
VVDVREVSIAGHIDNALPLMALNWDETGFDFPFDPDTEHYKRMEDIGLVFAVGAFDMGELIGYAVVAVTAHPHSKRVLCGLTDAVYVHPAYRTGATVHRLRKAVRDGVKTRGGQYVLWHTRGGTDFAQCLIKRGGQVVDIVVMEDLANGH